MHLEGTVVVVTGSGKGIGREVARMYAEQGALVIIAERNKADANETLAIIREADGKAEVFLTDVGVQDDVQQLMAYVRKEHGRLDILINNAGIGFWKSPYDISLEEWDNVINVNLRGTFLCAREAAKIMKDNGGGSIVNIASTRAIMSEANSEAYAASKGGIVALTHALAVSLAADHITVNVISPGWIETGDYGSLREVDHNQHPSRRVGKPSDIGRACLYLTAKENNFITGTNLVIDGGMTRKMIYEE